MKPKSIFRSLILASSTILASQPVHAAPYNWTGATDGTWNTGTNWSGSLLPTLADDLTILGPGNAAGALNINFDADNPARTIGFTNTAATTITNTTSGSDKLLTLAGSGTTLTVGSGAVTIGSSTANQGVNVALGANQTWNVGAGGLTVNSIISGTGISLTKSGSGTLTLSRANTFSGGLTLNGGVLAISNAQAMGLGAVSVSTGSARINAAALTYTNDISIAASRVLTIGTTGAANSTSTFSGAITGAGSITLAQGALGGTIVNLSSTSNTFTGNITMPAAAGTNDFINFASIGDGGSIIYGRASWLANARYTGAANMEWNTRNIALATTFGITTGLDGGGNPAHMLENNGAGTVTINTAMGMTTTATSGFFFFGGSNAGNNTVTGAIADPTGANTLGIGKSGTGKWILSNNTNSFEGNALIFDGTLSVGVIDVAANAQPLGKGSIIALGYRTANIGTLEYTGSANAVTDKQIEVGRLANSTNGNFAGGGVILNNGDGTLTFSNSTFNSTTGVPVSGTGVNRTLTLGGTNTGANTISGTIRDNNTAIGARLLLTKSGIGTWSLSGTNTYTGVTTVTGGVLHLGSNGALPGGIGSSGGTSNLTFNGGVIGLGAGDFSRPLNTAATTSAATFAGAGGWAAYGAKRTVNLGGAGATITWATANTGFNGQNLILGASTADATVELVNPINLGTAIRTVRVDNGSANVDAIMSGLLSSGSGGGLTVAGGGTLKLTNEANSFTGKVVIGNNTAQTLEVQVSKLANLSQTSSLGAPTTAADGLIQIGLQSNSSTLELTDGTAASSTDRQVLIGSSGLGGSGGSFILNNNTDPSHTLTFSNSAFNVAATGVSSFNRTLRLGGTNTGDNTVSGAIINNVGTTGGIVSLTKQDAGKWVLNGTNTYTGTTSVNDGTLLINGSTSTSSVVTVASGATLGGSGGTVGGNTTVNGTLASGSSIGTLNFTNALSLAAGSTYLFELDNTTDAADLTNVGGALSIAGTAILDLVQLGAYAAGDKFTLFGYTTGNLTGTFSGLTDGAQFTDAGGDWVIDYDDTLAGLNGGTGNLFVTITSVPEPNVAALIGALGGILLLRRRR